jgi:antitoxin HicB
MAKKFHQVYKYMAVFEPDKEVGGFTVTIPALPGCISEGDTFEEALANIKEAAELYLEVAGHQKENKPIRTSSKLVVPLELKV